MALLEIDSVIKYFDDRKVLSDVYLKCQTGDIIGLLGRNGSGKSTLLQIIFGTTDAEKFIRIDNKVYETPYKTKGIVAYLPQHNLLPDSFLLSKAVSMYLKPANIKAFWDDALLFKLKQNRAGQLSGGERRYAEIKLLLYTEALFILLDEPFNGISPVLIEDIKRLISEHSSNKGIILTDHDYRHILELSNHCHILVNGSLKTISNKADLVKWGYVSEHKI